MIKWNQLYNNDAYTILEQLAEQEPHSVDILYSDSPYNGDYLSKKTNPWNYIDLDRFWDLALQVIKPDTGIIMLFSRGKFSYDLYNSKPDSVNYHYEYIIEKANSPSFNLAKRQPMMVDEKVQIYSLQDKLPAYYPQMQEGEPYVRDCATFSKAFDVSMPKTKRTNSGQRYPRNLLLSSKFGLNGTRSMHPTIKSYSACEHILLNYINPENVANINCIDPFMGSGTIPLACKNNGINYIGCELQDEYFTIAEERLNQVEVDLP